MCDQLLKHSVFTLVGFQQLSLLYFLFVCGTHFLVFVSEQLKFISHLFEFFFFPFHFASKFFDDNLQVSFLFFASRGCFALSFAFCFCGGGGGCSVSRCTVKGRLGAGRRQGFGSSVELGFLLLALEALQHPLTSIHFGGSFGFPLFCFGHFFLFGQLVLPVFGLCFALVVYGLERAAQKEWN